MTIEQLISDLSDIGQEIGHKSEVRAWHLGTQEQPASLAILKVKGVEIGTLGKTETRIATINLAP